MAEDEPEVNWHLPPISRWIPTVSMMLVSLISYIDRNTLALLAPTILKDTGLSAEQYGWIISAFSVAYMIGNPVWGRLLDTWGLRLGMIAAVSFWTVASASHAFATGFWSFAIARACLGLGEGATFPGGLRTVVQTLPLELRSRGIATAYSGGSLGAVITPIIVTPVALAFGWRGAFWFTGFVGALWLTLWLFVSRNKAIAGRTERVEKTTGGARIAFTDLRLWSYMVGYAFCALPLAFVLYGLSIYLSKVLGKTQGEIGAILWIPPLGWEVGYFFWGWIVDRLSSQPGYQVGRMKGLMALLTVLSLPLAATTHLGSFGLVMAETFFAMFVAAGFVIATVAYATQLFSSAHSGLIAGLGAGSWSAVVALVMPIVGRLFDRNRYADAFIMAALFPVAGFLFWWMTNRRVRG